MIYRRLIVIMTFLPRARGYFQTLTRNNGYLAVNFDIQLKKQHPSFNIQYGLDLCCGIGESTQQMADCMSNTLIIGVDNDIKKLDIAKKTYPHLHFIHGNAEEKLFPANTFDHVKIQFGMLEIKDKLKVAKQVHNILKPNGNFYIIDYCNTNNYLKELVDIKQVYNEDYIKIFEKFFNPINVFENDQVSFIHYVKSRKN